MPNWYGMHGSIMICVEVCAGGYCVPSCSKFILKVFVMTNNGKQCGAFMSVYNHDV